MLKIPNSEEGSEKYVKCCQKCMDRGLTTEFKHSSIAVKNAE